MDEQLQHHLQALLLLLPPYIINSRDTEEPHNYLQARHTSTILVQDLIYTMSIKVEEMDHRTFQGIEVMLGVIRGHKAPHMILPN